MHQRPHERLIVWKEGYDLCKKIYEHTYNFPKREMFGLTQQMRRCSYSIPMNIAEGNAKRTPRDKAKFADITLGSIEELHCQLRLSYDLQYLPKEVFIRLDDHLNRVSYLVTKIRKTWLNQH